MIKTLKRKIASFRYMVRYGMLVPRLRNLLYWTGIEPFLFLWIEEGADYAPEVELKDNLAEYSFEFLKPAEMKNVGWLEADRHIERRIKQLEDGCLCLGVKHKEQIIGYTWAEPCKCSQAMYRKDLKSDEAYLFDMHIEKSFRGRNLAPYLRVKSYKILKSMGYNTCYSICAYFNKPSRKFKEKLNAKVVSLHLYMKLFRKYSWTWKLKEYKN